MKLFNFKKSDSFKHEHVVMRAKELSGNKHSFFKEKDYGTYIKMFLFETYYELLNCALNGDTKNIKHEVESFRKYEFNRNIKKALEELSNGQKIIDVSLKWFEANQHYFIEMATIYNKTDFYNLMYRESIANNETTGDFEYRILSKNKCFRETFEHVSDSRFKKFIKESIDPLL